ncbi:hypothetical protein GF412_01510 [Candidatus Micrarchaeota archaeon]|nr:hypothetical protein [Candidatus Micrarchaeota archaeon]MBD3417645.1 hypothetical protein [Candidatus Micrarchaeota archaeon]
MLGEEEAAKNEAEKEQQETREKQMLAVARAENWKQSEDYEEYQAYRKETAAQQREVAAFDRDYAKAQQEKKMEEAHAAFDRGEVEMPSSSAWATSPSLQDFFKKREALAKEKTRERAASETADLRALRERRKQEASYQKQLHQEAAKIRTEQNKPKPEKPKKPKKPRKRPGRRGPNP